MAKPVTRPRARGQQQRRGGGGTYVLIQPNLGSGPSDAQNPDQFNRTRHVQMVGGFGVSAPQRKGTP